MGSVSELVREHGWPFLADAETGVLLGCFFNLSVTSGLLGKGDVIAGAICVLSSLELLCRDGFVSDEPDDLCW